MRQRKITIGIDASRAFVSDPAGPEYYSWHTIKNLAKIDRKNSYVLYLRSKQSPDFVLPKNFVTKTLRPNRLWTQAGLALETILHPPDVLFIPAHTLPLITRMIYGIGNTLKLLPQMRILVTIHGLEGKFLPQSGHLLSHIYRNWSITWSVRLAHYLIAVSNDTLKDVLNTYKIHHSTIVVIQEGVDFEKYNRTKVDWKRLVDKYHVTKNYILFVGTLQPRKNLVRLVKAFSRVVGNSDYNTDNNKNLDLKLVIAGKPGWLYDEILLAPKRFKVDSRVVFTGRIDNQDLPGLYRGARAFVLPSLTEGYGLPVLEAQASGTPVVCSDRGALKETAGNAAIFIDPTKTQEITRAINTILQDKVLRAELIKKGIKNARHKSWERASYSMLKLFQEIAK